MMQVSLARADDALIDCVCQPLVEWIERRTALDCFGVARLCTDLSALAWILSQLGSVSAAAGTGTLGLKVFQFALIVLGLGAILVLRTTFERVGGAASGRPNPLRAAMYVHRLACLLWLTGLSVKTVMSLSGFGSLALLAVGGFATMAAYVGACSNHPPKRRQTSVGQLEPAPAVRR
jgi:hypothetical protein